MALLPDPTTAASERSSVKNRLTGSRRRGSGINRHRSKNSQQNEFKRQAQGAGASRAGAGPEPRPGGPGRPGLSRGVQGAFRGGPGAVKAKTPKTLEKARMRGGDAEGVQGVQGCLGGSRALQEASRGGSGYPLSVPAVAPQISRCWRGKRGRLNLPSVQHANQGWRIDSIQ